MKTKAVIARELGKPFEIVEAELDGPHFGEAVSYTHLTLPTIYSV